VQDDDDEGADALKRVLAALRRFRWLVVASVFVGAGVGTLAYRSAEVEYTVRGAIWVNQENRSTGGGPVRQAELLESQAWIELMRTGAVLDSVVINEGLYVSTAFKNRAVTEGFELGRQFAPGEYRLAVSQSGDSLILSNSVGLEVERVAVGDSVGRRLGFRWQPPSEELTVGREIDFVVTNPREASFSLSDRITANMDRGGNFIRLSLSGRDPQKIASILQGVMDRMVLVAADLKRYKLEEEAEALQEQLTNVSGALTGAENELEGFKVRTVTLPTDQSAPVAAGLQQTQGPVFADFFRRRIELESVRQDRERLEDLLANSGEGIQVEAYELVPAVQSSSQLHQALADLVRARSERRALLQTYTEEYGPVRELTQQIQQMEERDIPGLTRSLVANLHAQERQLQGVLDSRSAELSQIPPRAIEEARLQRARQTANDLYLDVKRRLETAQLASASSVPDIRIMDDARAPQLPSRDDRVRLFALALVACIGVGVGAAVLLDRLDPRLRYPTEVASMMGLEILGAVPRVQARKKRNADVVLEAFREIRMRLQYAYGNVRPMVLAVTSSESGEGKTFVTANLAITFAHLGRKTLVIDADTRRGDMHDLFELDRKPGLTDLFRRTVDGTAIQPTIHDNLHFLPCGSRFSDSPDMLSTGDMQELLAQAKRRYEVILIDSPPMAAGSDAFILGAHAGNVLIVLRSGSTHKEMARAKMEAFYRLPVRLLGAVLNDVDAGSAYGAYRYYSYYLPGYEAGQEEELEESPAPAAL
jgi:capsular exopolysaccharide synthesis family protein